uniref:Starch synthase, chloroplastic/amyloplastic n=2 Tax=Oryza sativa TaxID=4530 RepID=D0TZE3_ORYSI|nr:granule-bound starch synthase II [Oryza sativa Indica Group]UBF46021.1 granule-bound starch synthase II [Oryza sativa aus subgroup]UBF46029.1 granule-bound starch synthase II [Oryza sativa Japonica Group x Oryza sativa Indica Group]UBF46043.1 granule-bound starch synthase II [Oryza sativa tropical japonica subgroup]UBF46418.1 granule-bound starch synthase II [Oryza longistaminata]
MARTMGSTPTYCSYQTNGVGALKQSPHMQFQQSYNYGVRFLKRDTLSVRINKHMAKRIATSTGICTKPRRSHMPIVCSAGMTIIFIATECHPWCKTGGLGDVLGGLPPALAAMGHRVMTIVPRYDQYKDAWDTNVLVEVNIGDRTETVRFFHCYKRGVDRVFVDHPMFLEKVWGKTGPKLYGPTTGDDYRDNQLRFCLLCLAALEAPRVLNLNNSEYFSGPYGENVVFVANDWHTGVLPCYLKSIYQAKGMYVNAKVAFCIHNIAYQGRFAREDFELLNLPDSFLPSFDFIDGHFKPVVGRKINWMKAGITECDLVMTVSPHYVKELASGPDKGVELDGILRTKPLETGIVNGMDVYEWNPATDKYISVKYDATTVTEARALNKEMLQAEVGLPVDSSIPLIVFVGRLEEQKGSDILIAAIPEFVEGNVQIIVLGTGKKKMEEELILLEVKYPNNARGIAKFNVPLAHMMFAGADFIIVPSRFEPCGLIQLQGMRYGVVPICSSTGGLVDTVKEGVTGFHMGSFNVECETVDPVDVTAVASTVKRALKQYNTPAFQEMVQNCMAQDLSWKGPAKKWEEVLLGLGVEGSQPGIEGEELAPLAKENVATP